MKRSLFALLFCLLNATAYTQGKIYTDSLEKFRAEYISTHEVVKGNDKTLFRFFPINKKFLVEADFEKITDTIGFIMKTSGKRQTRYFKYGLLSFTIDNKKLGLTVYQSEQLLQTTAYKNYLFVPFTDLTSGEKSYGGGRYIDLQTGDIRGNRLLLDFNKAYNPYCAYAAGFNCPIPPRENDLPVSIEAGEMEFDVKH